MGPPIAAALSPDHGEWLAYLTDVGTTGTVQIWLARDDGEALGPLAEGLRGSPFTEQMSWSPDRRYLAFTLTDQDAADPEASQDLISDVWVVDTEAGSPRPQPVTDIGRAVAGTFDPDGNLWISVVHETATSFLLPSTVLEPMLEGREPLDEERLATEATIELPDLFQPLVSPDGSLLVAWSGRFDDEDGRLVEPFFSFTQGGAPQLIELAEPDADDEDPIANSRPLFGDLEIGPDAFRYAAVAWGPNSKAIAVWDAVWSGTEEDEAYPDPLRVYFGKSSYAEPINSSRALDAADLPEGIARIIDVAVAPDGRHLAITVSYPLDDISDAPRADLILVKRNFGSVRDEKHDVVESNGWEGPAVYPYHLGPASESGPP